MLKKRWKLFLGLIVLASSACVTPTHASSAPSVIITHVQPSGISGAKDEYVAIYNNSSVDVPISDWCLVNKSNVYFTCIETEINEQAILPAYSSAIFASVEFVQSSGSTNDMFTHVYHVINQSSGSLVGSGDTVQLIDKNDEVVDSYTWTASPAGRVAQRMVVMELPTLYAATGSPSDWFVRVVTTLPKNEVVYYEVPLEDHEDPSDPSTDNPPINTDEEPIGGQGGTGLPEEQLAPYITEVFPNPKGSDVGKEFIELYNPNASELSLGQYFLKIGPNLQSTVQFPSGAVLFAHSYVAFTNTDMRFTLLNTASKVQLFKDQQPVGDVVEYSSPKEDQSWAYFNEIGWLYTTLVTASSANSMSPLVIASPTENSQTTAKPCAANQYRNLETGRCRLVSTASVSTPTPCKANQIRNAETNRCRNIQQVTSATPCKAGQERNLETGRCRNIKKMSSAGYAVDTAATRSAEKGVSWYYWAAIIGIVVGILAYGVWEWREELQRIATSIRQKFARSSD